MEDMLKDFKKNWFLDETNTGIAKEHYKEEGFKQTILFKIERNELDEKYFEECLNTIKPLLNNENLVVCNTPIVGYQTNSYAVDDITDIESIKNSIKNGFIVLLYAPIIVDGELKFKTYTI
jgi:Mn-containing catalase